MRHWTFWEWVAYACLCVSAMIVAADTGFRLSPNLASHLPHFVEGAIWGIAPLALVVIATVLLVAHEFGWLGKRQSSVQPDTGAAANQEGHARVRLKLVSVGNNRPVELIENVHHYPLFFAPEGRKKANCVLIFEQPFEPYQAEIKVNGEVLTDGWSFADKSNRFSLFTFNRPKDGDTFEIGVFSKNYHP